MLVAECRPSSPASILIPVTCRAVSCAVPCAVLCRIVCCVVHCAMCHVLCAVLCAVPPGLGMVRRICLAPASPPVLSGTTEAALSGAATARGSGVERMRAAVLFAGGQVGRTNCCTCANTVCLAASMIPYDTGCSVCGDQALLSSPFSASSLHLASCVP